MLITLTLNQLYKFDRLRFAFTCTQSHYGVVHSNSQAFLCTQLHPEGVHTHSKAFMHSQLHSRGHQSCSHSLKDNHTHSITFEGCSIPLDKRLHNIVLSKTTTWCKLIFSTITSTRYKQYYFCSKNIDSA